MTKRTPATGVGLLFGLITFALAVIASAQTGGVPQVINRVKPTPGTFGTGEIVVVLKNTTGENCNAQWLLDGSSPRKVSKVSAPVAVTLSARSSFTMTFTVTGACSAPSKKTVSIEPGFQTKVIVPFNPSATGGGKTVVPVE